MNLDTTSAAELTAIGEVLGTTRALHESLNEFRERIRPLAAKALRSRKLAARCRYCGSTDHAAHADCGRGVPTVGHVCACETCFRERSASYSFSGFSGYSA